MKYRISALLLGLTLLCGCGSGTTGSNAPSIPDTPPEVATEPETLATDGSVRPAEEVVDFAAALALPESGSPDGDRDRMAHNIYADPILSRTSHQFSGFLIDFRAEEAGLATYWALCNWSMNTDCLSPGQVTDNGGAYAGLQMRPDGTKSIMSFWDIYWTDENGAEQVIAAQRAALL